MTHETTLCEDWLRTAGFRWHQVQSRRHWLLWIAPACVDPNEPSRRMFAESSDLGIELAEDPHGSWFCWVRADYAGRYTRLVHVRHVRLAAEVIALIEAMTGRTWCPDDVMYGALRDPETAARMRKESQRLDQRLAQQWGQRVEQSQSLDGAQAERLSP